MATQLDRFPIQRVVQVDPVTGQPIAVGGGTVPNPLPVTDNGGSLTVDGTVSIGGTVTVATHAVTQSGTWTVTATPPAGTNYTLVTAATTNGALIITGTVALDEVTISNPTTTAAFVKFYNKATAPTVGTDVPILTIPVPANGFVPVSFGTIGKRVPLGLGIAVTAGQAATDTAATVVGIVVNLTRH